jgi:hypothetical protein
MVQEKLTHRHLDRLANRCQQQLSDEARGRDENCCSACQVSATATGAEALFADATAMPITQTTHKAAIAVTVIVCLARLSKDVILDNNLGLCSRFGWPKDTN